jgi:hypothetical protein
MKTFACALRGFSNQRTMFLVTALAACGLAAVLLLERSTSATAATSEAQSASLPASAEAPSQRGYATLNRPANSEDVQARSWIARVGKEIQAMEVTATRVVSENSKMPKAALTPTRDGKLCLDTLSVDGSVGGGCVDGAVAASNGIAGGPPGEQVGVVPDGVDSITFWLDDGTLTSVALSSNFYRAPTNAVSAEFTFEGQRQIVSLVSVREFERAFNAELVEKDGRQYFAIDGGQ